MSLTALERIKEIEMLSPPSHYPQETVEFLLAAFKVMRGIAAQNHCGACPYGEDDERFEERMKNV